MAGTTTTPRPACPVCGTPMVRVRTDGTTARLYCPHCFHEETHAPAKKQNSTHATA